MKNILLTSVGRRSYLVDYFKQALGGRGQVIGINMFADAAGMQAADIALVSPPANSDEYLPFILDVCQRYEIGFLCSLHDLDVFMLSKHHQQLDAAGIVNALPSEEWGRITLDKYECTKVFEQAGIGVPWTSLSLDEAITELSGGRIRYPLIVKARVGFGSLGLKRCHNESELREAYRGASQQVEASGATHYIDLPPSECVIIQEVIQGAEICIGVVNDLKGNYQTHFACEIHTMRAGESDWATSLAREAVGELPHKVSQLTRHAGIWGIDCLSDQGTLKVIDVNPRFTGDYPFHHLAGANIPAALLALVEGETPDPAWFRSNSGIKFYKDLVPKVAEHSVR